MRGRIKTMIDMPLLGVAAVYFCLSWLMAWVILKLPVFCQTSWSLISVWGIVFVNLAEAWLRWNQSMLAQQVVTDIAIIFFAAFPGMLYLDFRQKQFRVTYWEKQGLPDELQSRIIYLNRRNVANWLAIYLADYRHAALVFCLVFVHWLGIIISYFRRSKRSDC